MTNIAPITVVETPDFLASARKLLDDDERGALIGYLSVNPEAGDIVPESGGVRKLRWALKGRGKRGGARVIYYFRNLTFPLIALDIYAKNERSDLTRAQIFRLRGIVKLMVKSDDSKSDRK